MQFEYYFAYGSNMCYNRLKFRIGDCEKVGTLKINGYQMVFNYGNRYNSFANLKADKTKSVVGVVYKVTKRQLRELDMFEGRDIPGCYKRVYLPYEGSKLNFYISDYTRKEFAKPLSYVYHSYLIQGAKENKLTELLKELQTIKQIEKPFFHGKTKNNTGVWNPTSTFV